MMTMLMKKRLIYVNNVCQRLLNALSVHLKRLKAQIALNDTPITELRDVSCHMGSHSFTCHPTQVNAPRLNASPQAVLDLTTPEGWKAELT